MQPVAHCFSNTARRIWVPVVALPSTCPTSLIAQIAVLYFSTMGVVYTMPWSTEGVVQGVSDSHILDARFKKQNKQKAFFGQLD
jgi:hypothetical protein